jgi:hypothetical protein
MEKLAELSHGAKVVLGAAIAFLLFSFFSWFHYTGPGADQINALGGDTGITMWHGVGWIAGLLAIALIAGRRSSRGHQPQVGVTPSMVTAALSVVLMIFAVIRFLDKPGGTRQSHVLGMALPGHGDRHRHGAWMNMRAASEGARHSESDGSAAAAAKDVVDRDDKPAAAAPRRRPSTDPVSPLRHPGARGARGGRAEGDT